MSFHPLQLAKDYISVDGPRNNSKTQNRMVPNIGKAVSYKSLSLEVGRPANYFSQMKKRNYIQYRYMSMLGKGDLVVGYNLFELKMKEKIVKLHEVDNIVKNRRILTELAGILDMYKSSVKSILCSKHILHTNTLKTVNRIIKAFYENYGTKI